ncbi:MAG: hypothetical protein R2857_03270 [Vampirovibrionales bacterium]
MGTATMILLEAEHDRSAGTADVETLVGKQQAEASVTDAFCQAFDKLRDALRRHIKQEETGIFPLADRVFEPEEKALVARRCQEIRTQTLAMGGAVLLRDEPRSKVFEAALFGAWTNPSEAIRFLNANMFASPGLESRRSADTPLGWPASGAGGDKGTRRAGV